MRCNSLLLKVWCGLWLLLSMNAWAEPPSRTGRITLVQGTVSLYANDDDKWVPAELNVPLTHHNSLWAEGSARAEARIGANAFRLDGNTVLDFIEVGDERIETFLQQGTLNIRTRQYEDYDRSRGFDDRVIVDTAEGRFIVEGAGRYRIEAAMNHSQLSVLAGRVRFEPPNRASGNALTIDAGSSLVISQSAQGNDLRFEGAVESSFDRWASARDQQWDQAHLRLERERVVSSYMTGYEDLDEYGEWVSDRDYGRLWAPRVVVSGWAPYRYGHWSYIRPWGWTWVDDAPWGFAPFHYGRWVQLRNRWYWHPGAYISRPIYAPALVVWLGGGSVSVSVGPSVGWFPLAPREHYVPHYTNNVTYIRNINHVTNNITVINPPSRYANQASGVTVVNQNIFVRSRPVANNQQTLPPAALVSRPGGARNDLVPPSMPSRPLTAGQGAPHQPGFNRGGVSGAPAHPLPPSLPSGTPQTPERSGPVGYPAPAVKVPQPIQRGSQPLMPAQSVSTPPAPISAPPVASPAPVTGPSLNEGHGVRHSRPHYSAPLPVPGSNGQDSRPLPTPTPSDAHTPPAKPLRPTEGGAVPPARPHPEARSGTPKVAEPAQPGEESKGREEGKRGQRTEMRNQSSLAR